VTEASKKNPLGATGLLAAQRVRELREARGWTYKELSDRLAAAGRPVPPLGLRRIESADRRIDADDLVALAVVLGVNPSAILLPPHGHGHIEVTGAGSVPTDRAWAWADGHGPLADDEDGVALADFLDLARPSPPALAYLDSREGRRRLAHRVAGLPGWEVEWKGGEVSSIKRPHKDGPVLFWPLEGDDDASR
jgi:transcriptional regulator with XRE-family HTH domain